MRDATAVRICSATIAFLLLAVVQKDAAVAQCPHEHQAADSRIIVDNRANIRDWPGLATLRLREPNKPVAKTRERFICGGTAIDKNWVLTAAHCIREDQIEKGQFGYTDAVGWNFEIILGTDHLSRIPPKAVFKPKRVIVHEDYDHATLRNDIALIELATPWHGPLSVRGALPNIPDVGFTFRVAGFGSQLLAGRAQTFTRRDNSTYIAGSDELRATDVPEVDNEWCSRLYPPPKHFIGPAHICAGKRYGGADSCRGDSGGPLILFDKHQCAHQVGVVSWGLGCAQANQPGVYTRISHYEDWIRRHFKGIAAAPAVLAAEWRETQNSRFTQLELLLSPGPSASQRPEQIHISMRDMSNKPINPRRISLDQEFFFDVVANRSGRLILIDVDPLGDVTQVYPDTFTTGEFKSGKVQAVAAGTVVRIPGENTVFGGFVAHGPLGIGTLIGILVPEESPYEAFVADIERLSQASKSGSEAVGTGPGSGSHGISIKGKSRADYLLNLIEQISRATRSGISSTGWAYGKLTYEIIQ